jgi:hypothetical protein
VFSAKSNPIFNYPNHKPHGLKPASGPCSVTNPPPLDVNHAAICLAQPVINLSAASSHRSSPKPSPSRALLEQEERDAELKKMRREKKTPKKKREDLI